MAPNPAIGHLAIVTDVRQAYQALPPGVERAGRIVNEVALRLQAEGEDAGLLHKEAGTAWNQRSIDTICYRSSGEIFDCLIDAENEARPDWRGNGTVDPTRWRAPVLIEPGPEPPPTDPPDEPAPPDLTVVIVALEQIVSRLDRLISVVEAQTMVQHEIRRTVQSPLQVVQPVKTKLSFG